MGNVLDFPVKSFNERPCDVGEPEEELPKGLGDVLPARMINGAIELRSRGLDKYANLLQEAAAYCDRKNADMLEKDIQISKLRDLL